MRKLTMGLALLCVVLIATVAVADTIKIGTKNFTEQFVLADST